MTSADHEQASGPMTTLVPVTEVPSLFAVGQGDHETGHGTIGSGKSGEYIGALDPPSGSGYKNSSGKYLMAHDGVGITFWLANGIMFASMIFFFLESQNVPKKWSASVTCAGLVS